MTLPRAEPRFFGPADRPLFGWLHCADSVAPARDAGLVVCNPFGNEVSCAHRSLRHFAEAAARLGVPVLRFDYDGTGDSAGDDRDPARWGAWLQSVHHAVAELRWCTGVHQVFLLGVRLGAALAALAASTRDDVAGLVAIMPIVSGKAWLREVHALELAMGFTQPPSEFAIEQGEESVGFPITSETKASLNSLDLLTMEQRPASAVLLIDREQAPNTRWVERVVALGARIERRPAAGYAEMMLDPHDAVVPAQIIHDVSGWLQDRLRSRTDAASAPIVAAALTSAIVGAGVEETPAFLEDTQTLFGVVSAPLGVRPKGAILLLNSGANPHTGPSRQYVKLSRRWAQRGYLVLRFDIAGIGDSAPWPGESENVVYSPRAVNDVAIALTYLRERWGVVSSEAVGLCSGAYHGFKAAVAGLPLRAVAVVNPLVFFWKPGMSLTYPSYQVSQATANYKKSFLKLEKWKKLLSGKVDVREAAGLVAQRVWFRAKAMIRDVARRIGLPTTGDLGTELDAVAARDVGLRFVFSVGDPGEDLLTVEGGSSLKKLTRQKKLAMRRIQGPNHSFTPLWSHSALATVLEAELDIR